MMNSSVPLCRHLFQILVKKTPFVAIWRGGGVADSEIGVEIIAKALIEAKRPLIVSGYLGRNIKAPPLLAELCDKLPIRVLETVGSDVCLRSDHEAYLGVTVRTHPEVLKADVIVIMDCDVPWIPTAGKPSKCKFNSEL
jgi:thiamine pyrophosphate-dependent acetolactate synthase large subunit-like protein